VSLNVELIIDDPNLDQCVMIELATDHKKTPEAKVQIHEERLQINSDDEEEKQPEVPGHVVKVLEERNLKIQEIISWVEGPCEEWLKELDRVCKSADEAQRLECQHDSLLEKIQVGLCSFINYQCF
jgi:hypothetical protein